MSPATGWSSTGVTVIDIVPALDESPSPSLTVNVNDVEVTELDAVVYSRSDRSPNATTSLASHAESSGQRSVPVAGSVIILIDTIASFASTSEYPQSEDAVQPA